MLHCLNSNPACIKWQDFKIKLEKPNTIFQTIILKLNKDKMIFFVKHKCITFYLMFDNFITLIIFMVKLYNFNYIEVSLEVIRFFAKKCYDS